MNDSIFQNNKEAIAHIRDGRVHRAMFGVTDLQGQLRGKSLSAEKMIGALKNGAPMTMNLAMGDFTDVVHSVALTETGQALYESRLDVSAASARNIPWEPEGADLCFLANYEGAAGDFCARSLYQKMEAKANAMGFRPFHALEYEAVLLAETHDSLHEKGFQNLKRAVNDSNYYGVLRQTIWSEFWDEFATAMETMGLGFDAFHFELAPGDVEAVLTYREGVRAADDAAIYKTFAKAFAQRRGMLMSFMARLSHESAGHSAHVHVSLRDNDGAPIFHDSTQEYNLSNVFRHFIGGLQRASGELMLMAMPNVNSWRRVGESAWSCDTRFASWGVDNKTTPLRVVAPGFASAMHLENRLPGADTNPYLVLAAVLGAGLWGIENAVEPTAPCAQYAYDDDIDLPDECRLPQSFKAAIDRFRASKVAMELFGPKFVQVFADTRDAQEREFREKVSEFELRRFLELA